MSSWKLTKRRNSRQIWRAWIGTRCSVSPGLKPRAAVGARDRFRRRRPFGDFPAAFVDQPIDKGADGIGKRLLDGEVGESSVAVGLGHRKHDNRRLFLGIAPKRLERHVVCLQACQDRRSSPARRRR